MPARLMPSAKTSGSGSGGRPAAGAAGGGSQRSRSTKTAPGRWPASNAAAPERPSRYHRTSARTTSSRCSASQAASTKGGSADIATHASDRRAPRSARGDRILDRQPDVVLGQRRRAGARAGDVVELGELHAHVEVVVAVEAVQH